MQTILLALCYFVFTELMLARLLAGRCRWNVQVMHEALEYAHRQRIAFEGGSSSTPQSRGMPRGLNGAQQVRAVPSSSFPRERHPSTDPHHPLAQLVDKDEGPRMRAIRVDEMKDPDRLKEYLAEFTRVDAMGDPDRLNTITTLVEDFKSRGALTHKE